MFKFKSAIAHDFVVKDAITKTREHTLALQNDKTNAPSCAKQNPFSFYHLLSTSTTTSLLVQRLGVGGGGGNVSVTGSLVRAGGLLQCLSVGEVGGTSGVVWLGVAGDEVEREKGEHCDVTWHNMHNMPPILGAVAALQRRHAS